MMREIVLLLFLPARFVREAMDHDSRLPPARNLTGEPLTWDRVRRIRRSLATAFGLVLVSLVVGSISGAVLVRAFGQPRHSIIVLLQTGAAGVILGATLAVLGSEIQSYVGQTLPEKVNRWLYRVFYVVGTYLLVLSLTWAR